MEVIQSVLSPATLTINQVVTLKLNDKNYLQWKLQFEQFLQSQLLLGYVSVTIPRPQPTILVQAEDQATHTVNPEFQKWVHTDQLIMAWIYGSLSEDALKSIYGLRSSQEVWYHLAKKYNRASSTRRLDIQRRIQTTTKGSRPITQYLSEITSLCDQLDSIGAPLPEQDKIYGVLNGLGREYESISTLIEDSMDSDNSPSFEDVMYKLIGFDEKLQTYAESPAVYPHQAFYSDCGGYSGRDREQYRGGYRGRGPYNTQSRGSYNTHGRGFPQQFAQSSGRGSYPSNNQKSTCQICRKYGHSAVTCYSHYDPYNPNFESSLDQLPQALAAMKLSEQEQSSGHEWYTDTGASGHITGSTQNLQTSQDYRGNDTVMIADGNFLPITHIGSVPLHTSTGQVNQAAADSRKQT